MRDIYQTFKTLLLNFIFIFYATSKIQFYIVFMNISMISYLKFEEKKTVDFRTIVILFGTFIFCYIEVRNSSFRRPSSLVYFEAVMLSLYVLIFDTTPTFDIFTGWHR